MAKDCSEVLQRAAVYALALPWSAHRECLMALEIKAACLFVCLCEAALHQMEDLFVFNTSVCVSVHFAYMLEWVVSGL